MTELLEPWMCPVGVAPLACLFHLRGVARSGARALTPANMRKRKAPTRGAVRLFIIVPTESFLFGSGGGQPYLVDACTSSGMASSNFSVVWATSGRGVVSAKFGMVSTTFGPVRPNWGWLRSLYHRSECIVVPSRIVGGRSTIVGLLLYHFGHGFVHLQCGVDQIWTHVYRDSCGSDRV